MLTLICCAVYISTHNLYIDVDNYMISTVTNRSFDSENYCIFLNPWLCRLVGALSDLLVKADALALLEHVLFFAEFCFLFYIVFSSEKNRWEKILYVSTLISVSQITGCWNANFTVQAAALVGGGILLLYSGRKRSRVSLKLFGTVIALFGSMLRIESALFFVPFILLDVVFELLFSGEDKKIKGKDLLRLWIIPVLAVSVLAGVQIAYNSSSRYAPSVEYSRVRSEIVDYQHEPWEEVQSSMPNVTETEYEAVCSWNLSDTENLDFEKLLSVAQNGGKAPFPVTLKGFADVVPWMFFFFRGSTESVKSLSVIIAVLWIMLMLSKLPGWRKAESILVLLGGAVIIWYFVFIGRAPFRIWEAVFLAIIAFFVMILSGCKQPSRSCKKFIIAGIIIIAVNLLFNLKSLKIMRPQLPIYSREYDISVKYDDEGVYIWNYDPSDAFRENGKLPARDFLMHNIVEGDWIYGQVYFKNFLESSGVQNPAEALANRDNVYYVSDDCRLMLEYLREHFNENLQVVPVGMIGDFPVWKFY